MRVDHEKKSDGLRVHHEKERWSGVDHERVDHEKKSHDDEKKSDGVRVHHEKERAPWGES